MAEGGLLHAHAGRGDTIIAVQVWFYFTGQIMLIGAETNRALTDWRKQHGQQHGTIQDRHVA